MPDRGTGTFSAALMTRVGGDREVFAELCDIFLDDAPKRLALIREALRAGDARGVQAAAHTYRGAASVFGADDIVSVARTLEAAAADGDLRNGEALLATLEARSRDLLTAIHTERLGGPCTS